MNAPLLPISVALGLGIVTYLGSAWTSEDRGAFLPGQTTHGHYQIELACNQCHEPWGGVTQGSCEGCHSEELERADDSHPKSKFTDPRNADRVAKLDARECITCHVEHQPKLTGSMGLTQPEDYCFMCHEDIGEERPTHVGLGFETCASAGCHNFHDNRSLHEDYLQAHLEDAPTLDDPRVRSARQPAPVRTLHAAQEPDAAHVDEMDGQIVQDWLASAHATAKVNCNDCHLQAGSKGAISGQAGEGAKAWIDYPGYTACAECHKNNVEGFLAGRHGMRLAIGLSPMRPEYARAEMKEEAHGRNLGCGSCHGAHRYDLELAATSACLECHSDSHSLSYNDSPHAQLAQREKEGQGEPGSGVTCATCHLPQIQRPREQVVIQHNQNANLRPNDKMIREVCSNCHGVAFSLDALADRSLVENNFPSTPTRHVESVDMVIKKLRGAR